jgi:transforming acidic coiled-coil-containing protein 3
MGMSCILSKLNCFFYCYRKYERSKAVIEGLKKNEEVLRASLAEYESTIRKQEQKYDMLKSHAMAQLERCVITF